MSSDTEEFFDAPEFVDCHPQNKEELVNNEDDEKKNAIDLNSTDSSQGDSTAEAAAIAESITRRRKLQGIRQQLAKDKESVVIVNSTALESTSTKTEDIARALPHHVLSTKCASEGSLEIGTKRIPDYEICDNEPDLIKSVVSSSLNRSEILLRDTQVPDTKSHNVPLENQRKNDVQTPVGQHTTLLDHELMPPPPVVPPRRHRASANTTPRISTAQTINSHLVDATATVKGRTLDPQLLTTPKSNCLLTAPSPLPTRRSLHIDHLTIREDHVTADETECNRAVNDLNFEVPDMMVEDTSSVGDGELLPTVDDWDMSQQSSDYMEAGSDGREEEYALDLDTGQHVSLNEAESALPSAINPLSLHIMRLTHEYTSESPAATLPKKDSETGAKGDSGQTKNEISKHKTKRKKKLKKLFGKAATKLKSVADEVFHHGDNRGSDSDDDVDDGRQMIRVKASPSHKGPYDFDLLVPVQDLNNAHNGAVWAMKFSPCGRLLATGGQDSHLKIWVVKDYYEYFNEMRLKYSSADSKATAPGASGSGDSSSTASSSNTEEKDEEAVYTVFMQSPFCVYSSHTADILDISWSKNFFILTSSMDKTVRLWHVSRRECLCCFQHIDFVTAISFHPKDDRYFLSGSLDGKLRLWNIPDKRVAQWNEVIGNVRLITAANFCMNGKFAVVGTYDGRCLFYSTDQMKYYTQIHVRSSRGKNAKGRKITGIEPYPGEDKILVTSNDSRIRMYDLRDLTLTCKYKGFVNNSSQIKASFSHDGRFLVAGSEDQFVYIWRTQHDFQVFSSSRKDRNDYWEAIKAHSAVVTSAVFAPKPNVIIKSQFQYVDSEDQQSTPEVRGEVLISSDYNGQIKVFINKFKPSSG